MIILGIVGVGLSGAVLYGLQGYILARDADQLSQKAQLTLARLNRELTDITAVSFADADRIDFTLPRSAAPATIPACATDEGCQYSIKITGTQITMEGVNPVIAAQPLIDGVTAANGGKVFLSYFKADGAAWSLADGFNNLARMQVQISLDLAGAQPLAYQGTINPRANGLLNAPQLE